MPAETTAPIRDGISGLRVLIVEDEVLVALDLSQELETLGADVVGVAATLADAQSAARRTDIDLAILDGNLRGERVDSVTDMLTERGVPFFFLSGYGSEHLPAQFRSLPVVQKPFRSKVLRSTLLRVLLPRETLPASAPSGLHCRGMRHGARYRFSNLDAVDSSRQDAAGISGAFACRKQATHIYALEIGTPCYPDR